MQDDALVSESLSRVLRVSLKYAREFAGAAQLDEGATRSNWAPSAGPGGITADRAAALADRLASNHDAMTIADVDHRQVPCQSRSSTVF